MINYIQSYSAADQASHTASATICSFNMGAWKEFDVTVRCSSSSGMEYNLYASPYGPSAVQVLITGCMNFGMACGTICTKIRNNNLNNYWIEAASTAGGREVSAAHIQVIVTAIKK